MNIPKGQLVVLGKILQYDQARLALLFGIFRDSKPSLFLTDTIKQLSEKLQVPEKETREIARTLYSVYASRVSFAHKIDVQTFVEKICEALQLSNILPADGDWNKFRKFIADLLNLKGAIELTSKAYDVLTANERNFIGARIVTDLRPVFKENPADEPAGAVIVHMLKFDYREDGSNKEFVLALDSLDVQLLKHLVERASIKEASLLAMAAKMSFAVVKPEP